MATATKTVSIIHRHKCPQCSGERMCTEVECAPKTPGTTTLLCDPCSSNPKTLLELKHELMDGRNELYAQFFASIVEQTELTKDQAEVVHEYLSGITEKRDRLADFIKGLEEEADRIRKREIELAQRRHEFEKLAQMFRGSILFNLNNWKGRDGKCTSITRVDGLESSFRVVKNQAHVEITDIAQLPGQFIGYQPVPDKRAIKDALDRGEKVPGAQLSDTSYHLQIK